LGCKARGGIQIGAYVSFHKLQSKVGVERAPLVHVDISTRV
jgi:hypothetical protein